MNEHLFNLTTGIEHLKSGKKIRKISWRETFSWIEIHPTENCLIKYDAHGLGVKIYEDIDLDNPGDSNNMDELVWEISNDGFDNN